MSLWTGEPKKLGGGRWIEVHHVEYRLPSKDGGAAADAKTGAWEIVRRAGSHLGRSDKVDAAELCILIREHGAASAASLAFVSQYRAPLDQRCLEFCAGLIDAGESVTVAALRELKEETGIADGVLGAKVTVVNVGPPIAYEPGMTNSCCSLVEVAVQLPEGLSTAEYIKQIGQHAHLEDAEQSMQLHAVPCGGPDMMRAIAELNCRIDAKVYAYLRGIMMMTAR